MKATVVDKGIVGGIAGIGCGVVVVIVGIIGLLIWGGIALVSGIQDKGLKGVTQSVWEGPNTNTISTVVE